MDKQHFYCPDCGKLIAFDDWEDIFDTSVDTLGGHYIEYAAFCCPHCERDDICVKIHYSLKFEKVELA